jgi:acetone carboxylase gamma subunit
MRELTPEQRERIAAQLADYGGYVCPDCLPALSVEITDARWRLIVDHSPGCASASERLIDRAVDPHELPSEEG